MDNLLKLPSQSPQKHWPEVPAERGQHYGVADPAHKGYQLVVMLNDTWIDFGTLVEAQRRKIEQQDKTLLQLKATNDVLTAELAKLREKHTNLKESERARRTKAVGKMFDL